MPLLTGTHVSRSEAGGLTGRSVARDGCRVRGGVGILARIGVARNDLDGTAPRLTVPFRSCPAVRYIHDKSLNPPDVAAAYLRPSGGAAAGKLSVLLAPHPSRIHDNQKIGQLLVGDFNHPSWAKDFRRRAGICGIFGFSDLGLGTYSSGNLLDRFVFAQERFFP